ncbi:MAG TPA: hypothetical protein VFL14_09305 [Xanthomonadales bacterium]|nr:hypothetical protein [Xanthomonadales bacterium]
MNEFQVLEGLPGEIAAKELQLASEGYSRASAARPESLGPGEYLLASEDQPAAGEDAPRIRAIAWRPN